MHKVLSTLLKLLAPITPYITDFLWQTLYSDKSIHTEQQAKEESNEDLTQHTQAISDFNSKVWNEKKEKGLHLPDSIKIEIPKELEIFKKDLVAMHHLEQCLWLLQSKSHGEKNLLNCMVEKRKKVQGKKVWEQVIFLKNIMLSV